MLIVMRNRFAISAAGYLIDAENLTMANRGQEGPYTCPGCGAAMITAMGAVMRPHFRHAAGSICARETYLHGAAKVAFKTAFDRALSEGRPYLVRREGRKICGNSIGKPGGPCMLGPAVQEHDLTRWFQSASLETGIQGFVADVLLEGKQGQMLIEIAVSHRCSPEKIASGLRIIEADIFGDGDILRLMKGLAPNCKQPGGFVPARSYGIKAIADQETSGCGSGCQIQGTRFAVTRAGKLISKTGWYRTLYSWPSFPVLGRLDSFGPSAGGRHARDLSEVAAFFRYRKKIAVKSCLLCRRHIMRNNEDDAGPVYCFERGKAQRHTEAAACPDFAPYPDDAARLRAIARDVRHGEGSWGEDDSLLE